MLWCQKANNLLMHSYRKNKNKIICRNLAKINYKEENIIIYKIKIYMKLKIYKQTQIQKMKDTNFYRKDMNILK